jgi:hypothetical protein
VMDAVAHGRSSARRQEKEIRQRARLPVPFRVPPGLART